MCDLISRSVLIEYLKNVTVTEGVTFETGFKQILTDIKNQPTVELKSVVHGEWNVKTKLNKGCGYTVSITCSACGYSHARVMYNFCPECGADMRKGGVNNV